MRWIAALINELSQLINESKRKYPEIRIAAEQSLNELKTFENQTHAIEKIRHHSTFLIPFFLGCNIQNIKCCAISVGCLQKLITVSAIGDFSLSSLLKALYEATLLSSEIQLKILQILPILLTNYSNQLVGDLLSEIFKICFTLQNSKYTVVQNTASATLRQLVILVFDRAAREDIKSVETEMHKTLEDAHYLMEDLCLLINGDKPKILNVPHLLKTFGLELIESILTNHPKIFQRHDKQIQLLRNLIFLVLRPFSHKSEFALTVRSARIIYLLFRQHLKNLIIEGEVAFNLFFHILVDQQDNTWRRILVMEIFRGICTDNALIRLIYENYDAEVSRKNILYEMIFSFNKLAGEQPGLIGMSMNVIFNSQTNRNDPYNNIYEILGNITDMFGGIYRTFADQCPPGIDSKASTVRTSCIDQLDKTELPILPPTYIYYLVLTCLNSIADGIAKTVIPFFKRSSFQKSTEFKVLNNTNHISLSNSKKNEKPQSASNTLSEIYSENHEVFICSKIIEHMWPTFLAAFSTFLSASLSIDLFHNVVRSYRHFAQASGYLGYNISRNAFLTNISKLSVPSIFVTSYNTSQLNPTMNNNIPGNRRLGVENHTNNATNTVNHYLSHDPNNVLMLTQKNLICLRTILLLSIHLGNNLGNSWSIILETLRKVELTILELSKKSPTKFPHNILNTKLFNYFDQKEQDIVGLSGKNFFSIDIPSIHALINITFENTKTFSDKSLLEILKTICELTTFSKIFETDSPKESKTSFDIKRSISSGNFYNFQETYAFQKSDELAFVFHKLSLVCKINIERLFFGASEKNGWDIVISYLYSFIQSQKAHNLIRKQATEIFIDISRTVITSHHWKNFKNNDKTLRKILSIINLLSIKNIMKDTNISLCHNNRTIELEIIEMSFDTLNLLLNSLGHLISESWDIVFQMISSIFEEDSSSSISFNKDHSDILFYKKREYKDLLGVPKILKDTFFSLQLICTDFLSELSAEFFLTLINILTKFCLQKDDLNISLTAIGLFWNISDNLWLKKSFEDSIETFLHTHELGFLASLNNDISVQDSLWIILLFRLTEVILDDRPEVRNGVIQTIFRNFDAHGKNIKKSLWTHCFQIIIYRIFFVFGENTLENIDNKHYTLFYNINKESFEESLILVISGLVSLFSCNFKSLLFLEIFVEIWNKLLDFFVYSSKYGSTDIFMHCCKAIDSILDKMKDIQLDSNYNNLCEKIWSVWEIFSNIISATYDENLFKNLRLSQEALNKFVNFTRSLYKFIIPINDLSMINKLIESTFNSLVYSQCPSYYLDIDFMTPLQSSVLEVIDLLKDNNDQTYVLSLKQLAKISSLAFNKDLLKNTASNQDLSKTNKIFSTYIAISKTSFEKMELYFSKSPNNILIYEQNAFFEIIQALSIPIKLKHKCPLTSRIGNDELFWKFSTLKMLSILEKCKLEMIQPSSNIELWEIINDCLHAMLLFDYNDNLLSLQESDEDFDISTYIRLRTILFPLIGDNIGISKNTIRIIAKSSFLYNCSEQILAFEQLSSFSEIPELEIKKYTFRKITSQREKLGFICLNDLFDFCSIKSNNRNPEGKCIAMITCNYLLKRCIIVLQQFILNQQMKGSIPISRIERMEFIAVIQNLINTNFYSNIIDVGNVSDHSESFSDPDALRMQLFPLFCKALPFCYQDSELLKLISLFFQKISSSICNYKVFA
ncbi:hypothetical protein PCANB_002591 [Pneumocystis canis]|nr:hypothetical protein PCANB_002591 [Pneumocystis canis]